MSYPYPYPDAITEDVDQRLYHALMEANETSENVNEQPQNTQTQHYPWVDQFNFDLQGGIQNPRVPSIPTIPQRCESSKRQPQPPSVPVPRLSKELAGQMQLAQEEEYLPEYPSLADTCAIIQARINAAPVKKYGENKDKINKNIAYYQDVIAAIKCPKHKTFRRFQSCQPDQAPEDASPTFKFSVKQAMYKYTGSFAPENDYWENPNIRLFAEDGLLLEPISKKSDKDPEYRIVVPTEEVHRLLCWAHYHGGPEHHGGRDKMWQLLSQYYNLDNFERLSVVQEFINKCTTCATKKRRMMGPRETQQGPRKKAKTAAQPEPKPEQQENQNVLLSAPEVPIGQPQMGYSSSSNTLHSTPSTTLLPTPPTPYDHNHFEQAPLYVVPSALELTQQPQVDNFLEQTPPADELFGLSQPPEHNMLEQTPINSGYQYTAEHSMLEQPQGSCYYQSSAVAEQGSDADEMDFGPNVDYFGDAYDHTTDELLNELFEFDEVAAPDDTETGS
ncbi:MAG: hypothetical protein LQ340_001732 [Diploschistes diacapsis]|nr:MAG: hypothetical protein LQ340_001732 [Diploschistes diacapsis]